MAHRYPSTDHKGLRQALSEIHGLDPERIICGVGSDEIITLLCQAYAGPGDEVLYPEHGFGMYRISALAAGATPVTAPETDRVVDPEAILAAVTERTRLIFIANPANPTGTMLPLAAFEDLAARLPDQCLLVMDGAYVEYADGYDGGAKLVETRDNVVMTRTFSKVYGLGWRARGLWLRAEGDHRGADAHPRSLQPVDHGAHGGGGGAPRHGLGGKGAARQCR